MSRISASASTVAIAILDGSAGSFAQGTGGSGPSVGNGSAVVSPNAGSAGAAASFGLEARRPEA